MSGSTTYYKSMRDVTSPRHLILAIESSCDETAAAVLRDGRHVLSDIVASQVGIHSQYGGIVPELASRRHLEVIVGVAQEALNQAGSTLAEITGLAVTQGPGLVGSLVVGVSFAKAIALAQGIPLTGVNHLQGHLLSIFLERHVPTFPYIGLVVSGGHTSLYIVHSFTSAELIGHTRDDAAGEAFDKIAKLLGLAYPGGPVIGELAEKGDPHAFKFPRAMLPETPFDFSFSGVKTAVQTVVRRGGRDGIPHLADICASFQEAVVEVLIAKSLAAAQKYQLGQIVLSGGVASNPRLRSRMTEAARDQGCEAFFPRPGLCTDNGSMIALAGYHQLQEGITIETDADVYSRLPPSPGVVC